MSVGTGRGRMAAPATLQRRTKAAVFLKTLGSILRLQVNAAPGRCEVTDPARAPKSRLCGEAAERIVQYTNQRGHLLAVIHTCTRHAPCLRYMAATRPGTRATVHARP
ncbi:hypothetical protein [Streptomyces sp. NPDC058664]|uniref:hypothetical protein n=1 Tax=unclassified Streptomyces TaxID=2593676 RepID=UPI003652796D